MFFEEQFTCQILYDILALFLWYPSQQTKYGECLFPSQLFQNSIELWTVAYSLMHLNTHKTFRFI